MLFVDHRTERKLWQEERTVAFFRVDRNARFVFDSTSSDTSADFKDKVFAFDSMDENDFVEFAYDRLLTIAGNPADPRRDWLRDFLSEVDESDKVLTLESMIAAKGAKSTLKP